MKNPQEDDAVERMLNQLEGLLKRQHDSARASRSGLVPLEEQLGAQPAVVNSPQNGAGEAAADAEHHAGNEGASLNSSVGDGREISGAGSNGSSAGPGKAAIELEEYDPDATAPEINAFSHPPYDVDPVPDKVDERDAHDDHPQDHASDAGSAQTMPTSTDDGKDQRKLAAVPASTGASQPEASPADPSLPAATPTPLWRAEDSPGEPSDGAHMTRRLTTRLGQLLLDSHLLSEAQLKQALEQQRESGERLGSILVTGGYIDETSLLSVLSKQHGVPTADLDDIVVDPALTQMIPADMARRYQLIPMAIGKGAVDVAMVDPTDFVAMAHVRFATGLRPNVFITTTTAADRAMARLYAGAETEAAPAAVDERPRDPRAAIKKMILDRDALLITADQDPRKFYELAASIDAFVDEIIRMAGG